VVEEYIPGSKGVHAKCLCNCDCGNIKIIAKSNLLAKDTPTVSCGCLKQDLRRQAHEKSITDFSLRYFHNWFILGESEEKRTQTMFVAVCTICGTLREAMMSSFKEGSALCYGKCDQLQRPYGQEIPLEVETHKCLIFRRWRGIMERCHNPKGTGYKKYGAKGIKVCDEWRSSLGYMKFRVWLEEKYPSWEQLFKEGYQLDRIDNSGPYAPWNCRLVTPKENTRNRTCTKRVWFDGQELPLADLIDQFQLPYKTVVARLDAGWDLEQALSHPLWKRR
jgi:hypothetical protein